MNASQMLIGGSELMRYLGNVAFGYSFDTHRFRRTIGEKRMSIIPKLATSLNRRDEVPNQELAAEIVKLGDKTAIAELIENMANKNKGIRHDCKTLYEIGYLIPKLISEHITAFLLLLNGKDNRMQWGAMTALGCIGGERPDEIFAALPKIIDAADKGSVITRDHCVKILVMLSLNSKYADKTLPLLVEQLMTCPANQLPMYAENAMPVVDAANKDRFIQVLASRLAGMERESGRKRVEKVIKKVQKPVRQ